MEDDYKTTRRGILKTAGAAGITATLAGCGWWGDDETSTEEGTATDNGTKGGSNETTVDVYGELDNTKLQESYLSQHNNLSNLNRSKKKAIFEKGIAEYDSPQVQHENGNPNTDIVRDEYVNDDGTWNTTALEVATEDTDGTINVSEDEVADYEKINSTLSPSEDVENLDKIHGMLESSRNNSTSGAIGQNSTGSPNTGMSGNTTANTTSSAMTGSTDEEEYSPDIGFMDVLDIYQDAAKVDQTDSLVERVQNGDLETIEQAYRVGQAYEDQGVMDTETSEVDESQHILEGVLTEDEETTEEGDYLISDLEVDFLYNQIQESDNLENLSLPENVRSNSWGAYGPADNEFMIKASNNGVDLDPREDYTVWESNDLLEYITEVENKEGKSSVKIEMANHTETLSFEQFGNYVSDVMLPAESLIENRGQSGVWTDERLYVDGKYDFSRNGEQWMSDRIGEKVTNASTKDIWDQLMVSMNNIGMRFADLSDQVDSTGQIGQMIDNISTNDGQDYIRGDRLRMVPDLDQLTHMYHNPEFIGDLDDADETAFEFVQVFGNSLPGINIDKTMSGEYFGQATLNDDTFDSAIDKIEDNGWVSSNYGSADSAFEVMENANSSGSSSTTSNNDDDDDDDNNNPPGGGGPGGSAGDPPGSGGPGGR